MALFAASSTIINRRRQQDNSRPTDNSSTPWFAASPAYWIRRKNNGAYSNRQLHQGYLCWRWKPSVSPSQWSAPVNQNCKTSGKHRRGLVGTTLRSLQIRGWASQWQATRIHDWYEGICKIRKIRRSGYKFNSTKRCISSNLRRCFIQKFSLNVPLCSIRVRK